MEHGYFTNPCTYRKKFKWFSLELSEFLKTKLKSTYEGRSFKKKSHLLSKHWPETRLEGGAEATLWQEGAGRQRHTSPGQWGSRPGVIHESRAERKRGQQAGHVANAVKKLKLFKHFLWPINFTSRKLFLENNQTCIESFNLSSQNNL